MPDILIRGMCKLESGKSYRALFKELNGKFVIVLELVESYADREVEIYPVEELPPHGDLIDLQAMLDESENGKYVWVYDLTDLPEFTKDLPVVVPAERREG